MLHRGATSSPCSDTRRKASLSAFKPLAMVVVIVMVMVMVKMMVMMMTIVIVIMIVVVVVVVLLAAVLVYCTLQYVEVLVVMVWW
jgi:hypothetical protein